MNGAHVKIGEEGNGVNRDISNSIINTDISLTEMQISLIEIQIYVFNLEDQISHFKYRYTQFN